MGQDGNEINVLDHYFDQASGIVNAEMISGHLMKNKRVYIMIGEILDSKVRSVIVILISP